ncbi:SGNH/GDSL hydrolase family protein [Fictibacillus halophilus]|uniref:SGNH/GDSL hydrolase family protein n=1 Tax=Fictibacillus halophilus TaxID=1610490 RepID=UPI00363645E9
MKKRRFLTVFIMVACVLSVIGGHFYYNNKLEKTAYAAKLELAKTPKEKARTEKISSQKKPEEHFENAPAGIAELFQKKKDAGESLNLTLVGSSLTSNEDGKWAKLFTSKMNETYGKDVTVETVSFGESTSLDLTNKGNYSDLVQKRADIFLIEPVLLNDNEGVTIEDTLFVLEKMINDIKYTNPEAIILIQPSNPIYQPQKYATQVSGLEDYAKEKGIPYLDHWEAWPSVDSEDINKYVAELVPNEDGHKLWAEYIYNIFK